MLNISDDEAEKLDSDVITRLKAFRGASRLKLAALSILVKMLNSKDIEKLRKEFEKIDTDNSGTIEATELERAIKNADVAISDKEIEHILGELDYSGDRTINYTEFLAATI